MAVRVRVNRRGTGKNLQNYHKKENKSEQKLTGIRSSRWNSTSPDGTVMTYLNT
jgi:hypothetical protein